MSVWLGIDPGVSGALAVIHGDTVALFDTPTRKATRGEEFLPGDMADLLGRFRGGAVFCVIEEANAPHLRPQQARPTEPGAVSGRTALKIGSGWGMWVGILAAYQIPYHVARSAAWKKALGLTGQDKKASRARAQELFPAVRGELARRRCDFAEALLLAHYGRSLARREPGAGG